MLIKLKGIRSAPHAQWTVWWRVHMRRASSSAKRSRRIHRQRPRSLHHCGGQLFLVASVVELVHQSWALGFASSLNIRTTALREFIFSSNVTAEKKKKATKHTKITNRIFFLKRKVERKHKLQWMCVARAREREREREREILHNKLCGWKTVTAGGSTSKRNHRLRSGLLQTVWLISSFTPISHATSMRGLRKPPSLFENNRRTPNKGDTIWRVKHVRE